MLHELEFINLIFCRGLIYQARYKRVHKDALLSSHVYHGIR